jgi:hypothetical protein
MTAQEIADRVLLKDGRELTPERVAKLKGLCQRSKVALADVLALLPDSEREKVQHA